MTMDDQTNTNDPSTFTSPESNTTEDNLSLLFSFDGPPTTNHCPVQGLAMLGNWLYVVYKNYDIVEVFKCEGSGESIQRMKVEGMNDPRDMVVSSRESQLFISNWDSDVIMRVNLKTKSSDKFVETGYKGTSLSLVENRLLGRSKKSLLMFDISSGKVIKTIWLTHDIHGHHVHHAIEYEEDSYFVSHGPLSSTVSEINSAGEKIRQFRQFENTQEFICHHMALASVNHLLLATKSKWKPNENEEDLKRNRVVLLDDDWKKEKTLIHHTGLENAEPRRLHYDEANGRLVVGLSNGIVKVFEYKPEAH